MSYPYADWSGSHFAASVPLTSACGSTILPVAGYANSVANDKFVRTEADPGFPLIGGLKDVGHMQQLGKDSGAAMPVVDIVMQHMQQVYSTRDATHLQCLTHAEQLHCI